MTWPAPWCWAIRAAMSPIGPSPSTTTLPPLRHVGVDDRLPRRRQHVGEVDEPLVRRTVGHLDVGELGLGHPQVLRLAARDLAVQLGEAEQGGTHALVAHLGGLALGVELAVAHEAVAARDLERHHHPVAGGEVGDLAADLLDDAHGLVAEDVALAHERAERLVQVQVRPTDVGRRDLHDRVGGLLDHRVGDRVHPHVALAVPGHCLHRATSERVVRWPPLNQPGEAPAIRAGARGRPGSGPQGVAWTPVMVKRSTSRRCPPVEATRVSGPSRGSVRRTRAVHACPS